MRFSRTAMDEKDPPPFGYTFSAGFFGGAPTEVDNGHSLLSDMETQHLDSFFSHANPFGSDPTNPTFQFAPEAPELIDDFSNWSAVPPATIHNISTTIPDQSLLHGFHPEQYSAPPQQPNQYASTADDLQAASTLYAQAQIPSSLPPYQNQQRAYSFHGVPSNGMPSTSIQTNGHESNGIPTSMPLVPTSATTNGLMHEQLAALLPNHDVPGSIDASMTTQFVPGAARVAHEVGIAARQRPSLKRSYTYGTDNSFNETGFRPSSKLESEEVVTKRLIRELHHAQPLARVVGTNGNAIQTPTGHIALPPPVDDSESNEGGASDESSADDDEERRQKKRRKRPCLTKNGKRKSLSAANLGKNRKVSMDDRVKKPRRKSMAGSKPQRENLTEEQKRNNHILSEQKRRNLIKRGFDDLHDLVPEIRNGGLSKSGVLMEAANFLQQLIEDNERYTAILSTAG